MKATVAVLCDLCGTPDPTWVYPARDFELTSNGATTACSLCKNLIERGDREGLAIHALTLLKRRHPSLFETANDVTEE